MSTAPNDSATPVSAAQIHELITGLDTRIDLSKLSNSTPFAEAGMDSLDFYNLVIAIEDRFHVTIPPGELNQINSVDKALGFLNKRLQ